MYFQRPSRQNVNIYAPYSFELGSTISLINRFLKLRLVRDRKHEHNESSHFHEIECQTRTQNGTERIRARAHARARQREAKKNEEKTISLVVYKLSRLKMCIQCRWISGNFARSICSCKQQTTPVHCLRFGFGFEWQKTNIHSSLLDAFQKTNCFLQRLIS